MHEVNKFHFVEREEIAKAFFDFESEKRISPEPLLYSAVRTSRIILIDSALEKEMTTEGRPLSSIQNTPLDLPFNQCWFELSNSEPEFIFPDGTVDRRVGAIIAIEGSFNSYAFLCYEVWPKRIIRILTPAFSDDEDTRMYYEIKEWVRKACAILNKSTTEVGQDIFPMMVTKVGKFSGNTKVRMANVPITIVVPRNKARRTYVGSNQLDFSHRFEVRGHWRKTTGVLGKNREGEYVVQGYTWVKAHIKGPEDKPVIKKTRIIKG